MEMRLPLCDYPAMMCIMLDFHHAALLALLMEVLIGYVRIQQLVHGNHMPHSMQYLFRCIVPHQCLTYIRKPKQSHAPTIRACIQHFNRVSLVVIATILGSSGSSERRGKVMERWVDVAEQCRLVKNFSSLKAIVCGMESSAIFRLKRSWQTLPE